MNDLSIIYPLKRKMTFLLQKLFDISLRSLTFSDWTPRSMNSEATSGFMVSFSIFLIWEELGKKFSNFRGFPDAEIV